MPRVRDYKVENRLRDDNGCIVTMRHRKTGREVTQHVQGRVLDMLPPFLAGYDPEVWAVQTISTPRTIAADLAMRPSYFVPTGAPSYDDSAGNVGIRAAAPEVATLARLGLQHYVEAA